MKAGIVLSLPVLLVVCMSASAEMYRWTDDAGNTTYSEKAPTDGRAYTMVGTPPPAASKSPQELADEKARQDAASHKGNPALDQELRRKSCDDARSNLALLKNSKAGDKFQTADGKEVSYTAEELALKIRENKVAEKAYCD